MRIGFTGSQAGMTDRQMLALRDVLRSYLFVDFVHGGCIGADAEAHDIAIASDARTFVFPSTIAAKRAPCSGAYFVHDPQPPLERNRTIVDSVDRLIAAPSQVREIVRSGTWFTVRYARRVGRDVLILEP